MRYYIVVAQLQHGGKTRHSVAGADIVGKDGSYYVLSLPYSPSTEELSSFMTDVFLRTHNLLYGEQISKGASGISIDKIGIWEISKSDLTPDDLADLDKVGIGQIQSVYDKEVYEDMTFTGIRETL